MSACGVGVTVEYGKGGYVITNLKVKGPAHRDGKGKKHAARADKLTGTLRIGDVICSIDGRDVSSSSLSIAPLVLGLAGTPIEVSRRPAAAALTSMGRSGIDDKGRMLLDMAASSLSLPNDILVHLFDIDEEANSSPTSEQGSSQAAPSPGSRVCEGIDAHELGLSLQDAAEQASRPKASRVPEMKLKEVPGVGRYSPPPLLRLTGGFKFGSERRTFGVSSSDTPGVGQYDVTRLQSSSKGLWSFGGSKRFAGASQQEEMPGPGEYQPETVNLSRSVGSKFGKARRGRLSNVEPNVPGPGAYGQDEEEEEEEEEEEKKKAQQRPLLPRSFYLDAELRRSSSMPGPLDYCTTHQPSWSRTQAGVSIGRASMHANQARSGATPGPGSYRTRAGHARRFFSFPRADSRSKKSSRSPGPGSYGIFSPTRATGVNLSSGVGHVPLHEADQLPGPGKLRDPRPSLTLSVRRVQREDVRELGRVALHAWYLSRMLECLCDRPAGKLKRDSYLAIDPSIPGPGQYNPADLPDPYSLPRHGKQWKSMLAHYPYQRFRV
ncbi:hypothetical protein GUITHDRAFT_122210 [Guillardia theta CCMP2712]|uniref:PDZ domain-containing protein n=1 Tax=Guillardia theta (strain CCMP2712) TaxID=905079 RepID=L1I6V4_GUITC|nr:hypothetical protein GUITHDRAFT_122210 [Guillardia theta CCMP2712]EKX31605.1 hypothetical protein GUITHDRAFT_122210 [Guillardia theta CCMP2712]|eukprot:XP_005818585.1 hypothetical protein GUITHDRAFT_122210 [Guillardia theta CCMP2712]